VNELSAQREPHKTTRVKVWADVDEGITDLVLYLNTIEGVTTDASCQGTIGEGGPNPYRAHVMAHWAKEAEPRLQAEFDVTFEGECWGNIYPREGWVSPLLQNHNKERIKMEAQFDFDIEEKVDLRPTVSRGKVIGLMLDRDKIKWYLVQYCDTTGAVHEDYFRGTDVKALTS
jgi:hypothetical protein